MFSFYYLTPLAYLTHKTEFKNAWSLLNYTYQRELQIAEHGKTDLPSIEEVNAGLARE